MVKASVSLLALLLVLATSGRASGPPDAREEDRAMLPSSRPDEGPASAPLGAEAGPVVTFRVRNRVRHRIDPLLFGQFMERPSWGEIGVEGAVVPGTHQLQPAVLKLLQEMKIPILRFPGGTDVDYMDWRDMIDNVPAREGNRPVSVGHKGHKVTNYFGYDEFLRLSESLKAEAILVVNLRDGLLGGKPVKEAALHAASLVAYCNAPLGARLPEGMVDWPAVRARNGRERPYGVKYVQIGNEPWAFLDDLKKRHSDRHQEVYADCVVDYVEAIRQVDPSVKLIMHHLGGITELAHPRLGGKVEYLAAHHYMPWMIDKVRRDGNEVPIESLTPEEVWYAWVAVPTIDAEGQSRIQVQALSVAEKLGYKVAFTEWNWNGGWGHGIADPPLRSSLAKGLGAAGYLHALMRAGGVVQIATQSMLVGNHWGITAIRADATGKAQPYYMPSGMATMLYSQHHGDRLMELEADGVPMYPQRLEVKSIKPGRVAVVDALATAGEKAVYLHAINRHFRIPIEAILELGDMVPLGGHATQYVLEGRLDDRPGPGESPQPAQIRQVALRVAGDRLRIVLPPRSVSVVRVERK